MSMKYMKFGPCPECTESEKPSIHHGTVYSETCDPEIQTFYAKCSTCGYETKSYNHVKDWNAASFEAWPFPSDGK